MNAENYVEYLAQPAKLYQLPYQEIKNLVEEYPYSANLRWLLMLKSKIEHDPKFEQHLHQFGAHTFDRKKLFQLIDHDLQKLLDLDVVERLELKDLNQMERPEKILVENDAEEVAPLNTMAAMPRPAATLVDDEIEEAEDLEMEMDIPAANLESVAEVVEMNAIVDTPEDTLVDDTPASEVTEIEWVITPSAYRAPAELVEALISFSLLKQAEISPLPTSAFQGRNSLREQDKRRQLDRLRQRAQQGYSAPVVPKAKQIARKSVQEQPGLASETLADLLVRQGQYAKAIKIYQRLSLQNPDKSVYFAATIENLKQKL